MKLIDILEKANENIVTVVCDDETGEILAEYDGKNSISKKLNNRYVTEIDVDNGELVIYIK